MPLNQLVLFRWITISSLFIYSLLITPSIFIKGVDTLGFWLRLAPIILGLVFFGFSIGLTHNYKGLGTEKGAKAGVVLGYALMFSIYTAFIIDFWGFWPGFLFYSLVYAFVGAGIGCICGLLGGFLGEVVNRRGYLFKRKPSKKLLGEA